MWSIVNKKIKVNESKIDNYVERMQQPLIPDKVKEDFKKITYDHAINYSKKNVKQCSEKIREN